MEFLLSLITPVLLHMAVSVIVTAGGRGNRRRGGGFGGVYFCDRTSGSAGSDLDVPERCGEGHALK